MLDDVHCDIMSRRLSEESCQQLTVRTATAENQSNHHDSRLMREISPCKQPQSPPECIAVLPSAPIAETGTSRSWIHREAHRLLSTPELDCCGLNDGNRQKNAGNSLGAIQGVEEGFSGRNFFVPEKVSTLFCGAEVDRIEGAARDAAACNVSYASLRQPRNDHPDMTEVPCQCLRYRCTADGGRPHNCCATANCGASDRSVIPSGQLCMDRSIDASARLNTEAFSCSHHPSDRICSQESAGAIPRRAQQPPTSTAAPCAGLLGNGNTAVSKAAVEAWAAAETWALTMAAATAATARTVPTTEATVMEVKGSDIKPQEARMLNLAEPREGFAANTSKNQAYCSCPAFVASHQFAPAFSTAVDWVCKQSRTCGSDADDGHCSLVKGLSRASGGPPVAVPPLPISPTNAFSKLAKSSEMVGGITHQSAPLAKDSLPLPTEMPLSRSRLPLGGAAAVVLQRIEHAEQAWKQHSQWTGMAMLRAHCLWAHEQRDLLARAVKYHSRVRLIRGFQTLKTRVRRTRARDGELATPAVVAVAMADKLCRARRLKNGVVMLKRNQQVCPALRSRSDLADLHFAESRAPDAVRIWKRQARSTRTSRNAREAATHKWRSRHLPSALARWVVTSLGDSESRRRRQLWRDVLLQPPPLSNHEGFDVCDAGNEKRTTVKQDCASDPNPMVDSSDDSERQSGISCSSKDASKPPVPMQAAATASGGNQAAALSARESDPRVEVDISFAGRAELDPEEASRADSPGVEPIGSDSRVDPLSATSTMSCDVVLGQLIGAGVAGVAWASRNDQCVGREQNSVVSCGSAMMLRERTDLEVAASMVERSVAMVFDSETVGQRSGEQRNASTWRAERVHDKKEPRIRMQTSTLQSDGDQQGVELDRPQGRDEELTWMTLSQERVGEGDACAGHEEMVYCNLASKSEILPHKIPRLILSAERLEETISVIIPGDEGRTPPQLDGVMFTPAAEKRKPDLPRQTLIVSETQPSRNEVQGSENVVANEGAEDSRFTGSVHADERQTMRRVRADAIAKVGRSHESRTAGASKVTETYKAQTPHTVVNERSMPVLTAMAGQMRQQDELTSESASPMEWPPRPDPVSEVLDTEGCLSCCAETLEIADVADIARYRAESNSLGNSSIGLQLPCESHSHVSLGSGQSLASRADDLREQALNAADGMFTTYDREQFQTDASFCDSDDRGVACPVKQIASQSEIAKAAAKITKPMDAAKHASGAVPTFAQERADVDDRQYNSEGNNVRASSKATSYKESLLNTEAVEERSCEASVGKCSGTQDTLDTNGKSRGGRRKCTVLEVDNCEDTRAGYESVRLHCAAFDPTRIEYSGLDDGHVHTEFAEALDCLSRGTARSIGDRSASTVRDLPAKLMSDEEGKDQTAEVSVGGQELESVNLFGALSNLGHSQPSSASNTAADAGSNSDSASWGSPHALCWQADQESAGVAVPSSSSAHYFLQKECSSVERTTNSAPVTDPRTVTEPTAVMTSTIAGDLLDSHLVPQKSGTRQTDSQKRERLRSSSRSSDKCISSSDPREGDVERQDDHHEHTLRNVSACSPPGTTPTPLFSPLSAEAGSAVSQACSDKNVPPTHEQLGTGCVEELRCQQRAPAPAVLPVSRQCLPAVTAGGSERVPKPMTTHPAVVASVLTRTVWGKVQHSAYLRSSFSAGTGGGSKEQSSESVDDSRVEARQSRDLATSRHFVEECLAVGENGKRHLSLFTRGPGREEAANRVRESGWSSGNDVLYGGIDGAGETDDVGEGVSSKNVVQSDVLVVDSSSVQIAAGSRDSTSSSSHRGGATMLQERVSEAFRMRRLRRVGFRIVQRRCDYDVNTAVLHLIKRAAVAKWRVAHSSLMARKSAAAARISSRHRVSSRLGWPNALTLTPAPAMAIVALKRWRRQSANTTFLNRTFRAWATFARGSASVRLQRLQALAKRGLLTWRIHARESRRSKDRVAAAKIGLLRSNGRRRLRAWIERRHRRDVAFRTADVHRSSKTAVGSAPLPTATKAAMNFKGARGWQVLDAFMLWRRMTYDQSEARFVRRDLVIRACQGRQRRAMQRWHRRAACRIRRRRVSPMGEVHYARREVVQGLRALQRAAQRSHEHRQTLEAAIKHRKQRAVIWIIRRIREALLSRRRFLRRACALRLRMTALAGLRRWRRIAREGRAILDADPTAGRWRRKRMFTAGFAALTGVAVQGSERDRSTRFCQEHFYRRSVCRALNSWRVWSLRRAACRELSAAASDLCKARISSVGLRALDRSARMRIVLRGVNHSARLHFMRNAGLQRWRVAVAQRRRDRAKTAVASVHWAANLLGKVLRAWEAIAVQQWAGAKQEEIAERHERRSCQRRGLKTWAAIAL